MGWFDQLGYNIAPFFGPIGRGIQDAVVNSRVADVARQYNEAPDLTRFAAIQTPDNIYDPAKLVDLEKLRESRLAKLQAQEAAPIAGQLARFAAEGNDADPNFTGSEWVKGMMTTPALGGTMTEEDYDALKAGAVPGRKKGAMPISAFAANPVTADLLQKAEQAAQNKGTMARAFTKDASPMDLATLAMNKEMASGFDNTTQGGKRIFDQSQTVRTNTAEDALNNLFAEYPLTRSIESWNGLANAAYAIPGIDPKVVDARLKDVASRNQGPTLKQFSTSVSNGPNSTVKKVSLDMFGEPVTTTAVTSSNNPSDREMGFFGGTEGGASKPKNPVFYLVQKPDGRLVQVDATTTDGRERLAAARRDGEKISKMGTQSESQTVINPDGSVSTKRVSGPAASSQPEPIVTVTRDPKTGKLVIKR